MANMKDVAKLANVSITTVYRVIHNNGYVKKETRNAIEQAIKELDYYPNNLGRSLNKNLVNIIAVIAPIGRGEVETDSYYVTILSGIEAELADSGIDILLSTQRPKIKNGNFTLDYCKLFLERKVDGIIILNGNLSERDYSIIQKNSVPVCMVSENPDYPVVDYIDVDNYKCFREILEEIYNKGHRKIAFGGYSEDSKSISSRFKAYKEFINDKGLKFRDEFVFKTGRITRSGSDIINKYMSLEDKPSVIAFSTDNLAIEAFIHAEKAWNRYSS